MSVSELKPPQIRALLLLLVLLPFIPTVLMLRLMVGAVQTEHEIAQERIADLYQRSLATVGSYLPNRLKAASSLDPGETPREQFEQLILEHSMDGALFFDEKRRLVFPTSAPKPGEEPVPPKVSQAEDFSRSMAARSPDKLAHASLLSWTPLPGAPDGLYVIRTRIQGENVVFLRRGKTLSSLVQAFYSQTFDPIVSIRIQNERGEFFPRIPARGDGPFVQTAIGDCLPGWQVQLFLNKSKVLVEGGAQDQLKAYIWIAAVAIAGDLFIAGVAAFAVSRQLRLNELRNSSLATVSHELKTPIASVRMLIDTILEGRCERPGQAREYIELISGENHRLGRVVENFLAASRIESGSYSFNKVETPPSEIVDATLEVMGARLKAEGCRLDLNVDPDLPPVRVERDALVVVLVNLLENALKYSPGEKRISLDAYSKNGAIVFEVGDNGAGIPWKHRKKIFERFYQIDQKLSRRQEGTGLGLSIVKYIVEAHGGSVAVRSGREEGSVFSISLPSVAAATALTWKQS